MNAPMRPDRLAEGTVPQGKPTVQPSVSDVDPGASGAAAMEDRASGRAPPVSEEASVPATARRLPYEEWLKGELAAVIDQLDLSELQKRCLRSRWLDTVMWVERKAKQAQRLYYALRLVIIIGGVIIPALVSLDLGTDPAAGLVRWAAFGLSLLVAISAALDGLFRFGERWRHYRLIAERLKIEGWQFFQLSGPYAHQRSHAAAHPELAARVEEIIKSDVDRYITEVVREKPEQSSARADHAPPGRPSS
jgi:hypothetical protein